MNQNDVKKWLAETGRDRRWLAEKCGVALQTVNNWLSTNRGLPSKAKLTILGLMQTESSTLEGSQARGQSLVIRLTDEEFDRIERAANLEGKGVRQWVVDSLNHLAAVAESDPGLPLWAAVAEDEPTPFNRSKKKR